MPIKTSTCVVIAVSAMFLLGCGGDSGAEPGNGGATGEVKAGCTERAGLGWTGRSNDGAIITAQTREACEERLR